MMRAGGFGLLHQCRDRPPGLARLCRLDAVEAEHHRGIKHAAVVVAELVTRAGPSRQIAVARAVDEDVGAYRLSARLGFHHHRADTGFVEHHDAGAKRVEQHIDPVGREQIVGRDLIGGGVIGLRQNFPQNQMRRIEAAEPVDARQQIGRDALHDAMHLAMDIGVQSAKIRHSRRRAHAAEESIALD